MGKFCGAASELGIAEEWYARTALEDLCGIPVESVNEDRLYRALDKVGEHKDRLCAHLMERYRQWFGVRFEFLLYDVTSTYFERKALYIVGTPKSQLRFYDDQLTEKKNWVEVESGVEARLVDHPDGNGQERYVLCRSSARGAKERAMIERQMNRLTEEMLKIDRSLQCKAQSDLDKIGRRIGRSQGKYPAACRLLDIELIKDSEGCAWGLQISCPLRRGDHPLLSKGAYLLRTNCTETDPDVALLLAHLGLHLPKGSKLVQNVVEKIA